MMLKLDDVPKSAECGSFRCGVAEIDLDLTMGLECLVACELWGRVASPRNPGYDVYDSALYPGLTFQVKQSKAWLDPGRDARKRNRSEVYTFRGHAEHEADWYVLFGVKGDELWLFFVPLMAWRDKSSVSGAYRTLIISANMLTRRTKALKQNRLWEFHISDWPSGLHRRLSERQERLF